MMDKALNKQFKTKEIIKQIKLTTNLLNLKMILTVAKLAHKDKLQEIKIHKFIKI